MDRSLDCVSSIEARRFRKVSRALVSSFSSSSAFSIDWLMSRKEPVIYAMFISCGTSLLSRCMERWGGMRYSSPN